MQNEVLLPGTSTENQGLSNKPHRLYPIANKRIDTKQIRPKMLSKTKFTMGPENCLEVDILPNLPSSNGCKHIITNFFRYLFVRPTHDMTARTVGRCISDVMTRRCHLPLVILTDNGSQFTSEMVNQIAQTLAIRNSHASTKHAQTNGILERTHEPSKTSLKKSTRERRSMWHKDEHRAVMNTSYHESLRCEHTNCSTDAIRTTFWTSHIDSNQNGKETLTKT